MEPSKKTLYMREWRKKHPERKEYMKNYRKEHRTHINELDTKWRHNNPEVIRVSNSNYRVKNKKKKAAQLMAERHISLAEFCELCPEDDIQPAIERHHPDYNYPLIVVFCCKECHHYADKLSPELKEGWLNGNER